VNQVALLSLIVVLKSRWCQSVPPCTLPALTPKSVTQPACTGRLAGACSTARTFRAGQQVNGNAPYTVVDRVPSVRHDRDGFRRTVFSPRPRCSAGLLFEWRRVLAGGRTANGGIELSPGAPRRRCRRSIARGRIDLELFTRDAAS